MMTITDFLNKYSSLTSVNVDDIIPHLKLSLTNRQYILLHEEAKKLITGSENFDQKIANVFLKLLNKFNYLILIGVVDDPISLEYYRGQELELININYIQLNNHFDLFAGLKTLVCSKCVIPSLKDIIYFEGIDLDGYIFLKKLQLNSCKLRSIDNSIFLLKNLTILNLSRNKLHEFTIDQLILTNLKFLDLSYNFLSSLNFIPLHFETDSIKKPLEMLQCLYVRNNHISSLKGVEKFVNLQILEASNNLIAVQKSTIYLKRLRRLTDLNLNGNPIIFQKDYRKNIIKNLHSTAAFQFSLDNKDLTNKEKMMKMNENLDTLDASIDSPILRSSCYESLETPVVIKNSNTSVVIKSLSEIPNSLTTPASLSAARIHAFLASDTYSDYHTCSTDTTINTDNSSEIYDLPIAQNFQVKKPKFKNRQHANIESDRYSMKLEKGGKNDATLCKNVENIEQKAVDNKVGQLYISASDLIHSSDTDLKLNALINIDDAFQNTNSRKSNTNIEYVDLVSNEITQEFDDLMKPSNSHFVNTSNYKHPAESPITKNNTKALKSQDLGSKIQPNIIDSNEQYLSEDLISVDKCVITDNTQAATDTIATEKTTKSAKLKNTVLTTVDVHLPSDSDSFNWTDEDFPFKEMKSFYSYNNSADKLISDTHIDKLENIVDNVLKSVQSEVLQETIDEKFVNQNGCNDLISSNNFNCATSAGKCAFDDDNILRNANASSNNGNTKIGEPITEAYCLVSETDKLADIKEDENILDNNADLYDDKSADILPIIESIFDLTYNFNAAEFTGTCNNHIENVHWFAIRKVVACEYNAEDECLEFERSTEIRSVKIDAKSHDDVYETREVLKDIEHRHCYEIKVFDCKASSSFNNDYKFKLCTVGNHWLYFVEEDGKVDDKFDLRSLKQAAIEDIDEGEEEMIKNGQEPGSGVLEEGEVAIKLIFDTLKQSRQKRILILKNLYDAQELLEVVSSFIKIVMKPKMECLKCEYIFEDANWRHDKQVTSSSAFSQSISNLSECPKCGSTALVQTNKPLAQTRNSSWANFFKLGESDARNVPARKSRPSLFGGDFGFFGTSWSNKNVPDALSNSPNQSPAKFKRRRSKMDDVGSVGRRADFYIDSNKD